MFEANKECYNNTEGHPLVSLTGGHGGGGGGGAVSDTFRSYQFELFVRSRSRFSNLSYTLGPMFKFLSIVGDNVFIFPL